MFASTLSGKRVFQFTCGSELEFQEWSGMLADCCANASSPMNPEEVRRRAFAQTYQHLEEEAGWGRTSFQPTGTEADMLT